MKELKVRIYILDAYYKVGYDGKWSVACTIHTSWGTKNLSIKEKATDKLFVQNMEYRMLIKRQHDLRNSL